MKITRGINELKKMISVKFHIISRLGATSVQKEWFGCPKIQLSSKWPNLKGRLKLNWRSFFALNDFPCAILSF